MSGTIKTYLVPEEIIVILHSFQKNDDKKFIRHFVNAFKKFETWGQCN
jgi:hypothetical protein